MNIIVKSRPNILFISSANPDIGPGRLIYDWQKVLKLADVNYDMLLLNPVESHSEFMHVNDGTIWEKLNLLYNKVLYNKFNFDVSNNHCFFYRKEENPKVSINKLLSKITKPYDMVLIHFWQDLLTFKSIKAIYNKLHCQIHFLAVDYSHMSGGCHFIGDCEQYKTGCMNCKAVKPLWMNDFTAHNVQYRKKVYDYVKPIVWGNSYMQGFYKQSYLLKNARMELSTITLDLDELKPYDIFSVRKELNVDDKYRFVLTFGCQSLSDTRKGMDFLIKSLTFFFQNLSKEEQQSVLVLTVGSATDELKKQILFDTMHMGFVSYDLLKKVYACSDVYLSPSVNDAGPMMVNQSLCCGTPVVAFEMGTAIDCIKGQGTGYCAKYKDYTDFAIGIDFIFRQNAEEKYNMRRRCRQYALENYSYEAKAKWLLDLYNKYK